MTALQTTQEFYALFGNGKIAELLERFVDEDSVLDNPLPDPITFGGQFKGRQGFGAYVQGIFAAIEIEQFEIDELIVDGDRVAVLGRETSRVLSTGKRYSISWVHVLTVRDGRVKYLREYNDTAAMALAFTVTGK